MTVAPSTTRPESGERERSLDLVARAQAGEEAAFRELFVAHRDTVVRVVARMIGPSHPELEDVVQDVFLHVYRSLKSFRGDAKFSTWLYRLAVNVTKMHLRKKRSRPRFADAEVQEHAQDSEARERMGDTVRYERPDDAMDRRLRVDAFERLVASLSDKKREVLVLHDLEGKTAQEIAEIVEAPIMTVRTRLFYARKELYAALAADPALRPVVERYLSELPGKPVKQTSQGENAPKGSAAKGSAAKGTVSKGTVG